MKFTFGIITDITKELSPHMERIIQSIRDLRIPEYEILIVGNNIKLNASDIKVIHFNDKPGWITRQKNLITKHAQFENIVYQHDYIYYNPDWFEGFKKFGDNFTICMTQIRNKDDVRFRDWTMFPYHSCVPMSNIYAQKSKALWDYTGIWNNESMLPYDETRLVKYQYISGSYWVAKKYVMNEFPLNESLKWQEGEDVEFSMRVLNKYTLTMNQFSTVHFDKWKQDAFTPIKEDVLQKCIEFVTKRNQ